MTSARPFVSQRRSGVTFAILVMSSLLLIGLDPPAGRFGLLSLIQTGISSGSRWVGGAFTAIGEFGRSRTEVQALRVELAGMEQRQRAVVQLEAENRNLRALLNLLRTADPLPIAAEVIGRDPGNRFKTITINRGRRHGVRIDATVVAEADGFQALVGKVESVSSFTAIVRPILDGSSYVSARLQRSEHDGQIQAEPGSRQLVMRYVPRISESDLAVNDLVITSGMGNLYPRGVYIGRVVEYRAGAERSSIEVIVSPLVDFGRLDYVLVLDTVERFDE